MIVTFVDAFIAFLAKSHNEVFTHKPTRTGGDTKITPSPLTNSMGIFLLDVCKEGMHRMSFNYIIFFKKIPTICWYFWQQQHTTP